MATGGACQLRGRSRQIKVDKLLLADIVEKAVHLHLVHHLTGKRRSDAVPVVLNDAG